MESKEAETDREDGDVNLHPGQLESDEEEYDFISQWKILQYHMKQDAELNKNGERAFKAVQKSVGLSSRHTVTKE